MPDDYLDLNTIGNDDQKLAEIETKSSIGLERWAHFPALLVFGLLILPLHSYPWGWQIAIAGGYTVYVFWFALGSGKKDLDDLTGDTLILRKIASQLLPHLLVLVIILAGVSEWFHLRPLLPSWVTHEGRKGSFWDLLGWLLLAIAGIAQGFWMAGKIKSRFGESED
jgi:hypothetical protein